MNVLTDTSKMPCRSFSLPAIFTCPGARAAIKYAKETGQKAICEGCYAQNGFYRMPNVKDSQAERLEWRNKTLVDGSFVPLMISEIADTGDQYFRIHDSGDFDSASYVRAWHNVVAALPKVKFCAPTRSWVDETLLIDLRKLAQLPNITVRPSALTFGGDVPQVKGLHAGTSADKTHFNCPAPYQNNECRDCRKCWDEKDQHVVYK